MADNETRKYRVVSPLLADKKHYQVGDQVTLPAETGEPLAAQGVLEPVLQAKTKDKEE